MYIQRFVKGIVGPEKGGPDWGGAQAMLKADGITSNWFRSLGGITPSQIEDVLTSRNLDRHLHDYVAFGSESPFISLACGCVERDFLLRTNHVHAARTTALSFATDDCTHAGYLFYGWVVVGVNPAIQLSGVAESVRDLNVYQRWSRYQLEGEVTAKVYIPANQLERVEHWDCAGGRFQLVDSCANPRFAASTLLANVREIF